MSDSGRERLLLIDTCGETAGVAVCADGRVLAMEEFAPGRASAEIVAAVRRLLESVGWKISELDAVGVVSGPGSFTGVRTGMAAAKGLCEASGVRLIAVSRLAVLADAAGATEGLVALDAGRGELYVREVATGREWMCRDAKVVALAEGQTHTPNANEGVNRKCLVVAEQRVAERLAACMPMMRALHVEDALGLVGLALRSGREDEVVDANYVRGEQDIYRKVGEPVKAAAAGG